MSDYLIRLAARSLRLMEVVMPRLGSIYEPSSIDAYDAFDIELLQSPNLNKSSAEFSAVPDVDSPNSLRHSGNPGAKIADNIVDAPIVNAPILDAPRLASPNRPLTHMPVTACSTIDDARASQENEIQTISTKSIADSRKKLETVAKEARSVSSVEEKLPELLDEPTYDPGVNQSEPQSKKPELQNKNSDSNLSKPSPGLSEADELPSIRTGDEKFSINPGSEKISKIKGNHYRERSEEEHSTSISSYDGKIIERSPDAKKESITERLLSESAAANENLQNDIYLINSPAKKLFDLGTHILEKDAIKDDAGATPSPASASLPGDSTRRVINTDNNDRKISIASNAVEFPIQIREGMGKEVHKKLLSSAQRSADYGLQRIPPEYSSIIPTAITSPFANNSTNPGQRQDSSILPLASKPLVTKTASIDALENQDNCKGTLQKDSLSDLKKNLGAIEGKRLKDPTTGEMATSHKEETLSLEMDRPENQSGIPELQEQNSKYHTTKPFLTTPIVPKPKTPLSQGMSEKRFSEPGDDRPYKVTVDRSEEQPGSISLTFTSSDQEQIDGKIFSADKEEPPLASIREQSIANEMDRQDERQLCRPSISPHANSTKVLEKNAIDEDSDPLNPFPNRNPEISTEKILYSEIKRKVTAGNEAPIELLPAPVNRIILNSMLSQDEYQSNMPGCWEQDSGHREAKTVHSTSIAFKPLLGQEKREESFRDPSDDGASGKKACLEGQPGPITPPAFVSSDQGQIDMERFSSYGKETRSLRLQELVVTNKDQQDGIFPMHAAKTPLFELKKDGSSRIQPGETDYPEMKRTSHLPRTSMASDDQGTDTKILKPDNKAGYEPHPEQTSLNKIPQSAAFISSRIGPSLSESHPDSSSIRKNIAVKGIPSPADSHSNKMKLRNERDISSKDQTRPGQQNPPILRPAREHAPHESFSANTSLLRNVLQREQDTESSTNKAPPSISIAIGRVDVRSSPMEKTIVVESPFSSVKKLSLDDYLKMRNEGRL